MNHTTLKLRMILNFKSFIMFGFIFFSIQQAFAMTQPEITTSEIAKIIPATTMPTTKPVVATEKIEAKTEAPVSTDYVAKSKAMLHKLSIVAYNATQRAIRDLHRVMISAVTTVKDMSEDLSTSIRHYIHEKTADNKENKVVVQRRNEDESTTTTTYIPEIVAYQQGAPVIGYEEVVSEQNTINRR